MRNWQRVFGLMPPALMLAALGMADVSSGATPQVKAGENHTVMLRSNGSIWACGDNSSGQLGDGTTTPSNVPVQVTTATDWTQVSAGMHHTVAIKADGTLWAWGDNTFGQLGNGQATLVEFAPVQIGTDTKWSTVSAGDFHTVAMKTDGTIWAWGDSADGTLGTGETYSGIIVTVPTQIGTATDWVAIATGQDHTLAVKANGQLWGWGSNGSGQLGDQSNLEARGPIQIGTASDWASVTTRGSESVARKKNGTLFSFGLNAYGQLGDGTFVNKDLPTQVGIDANWSVFGSGDRHTAALKADGTLWTWGDNGAGQLGAGATGAPRNTPLQIGTATDFVAVEAGEVHTVALKANGTVFAMGDNTLGQLCNGSNVAKAAPTPGVSPISGDLDEDGNIDINDAVRALRVGIGLSTATATEVLAGDVGPLVSNLPAPDGAITIGDAIVILRKVVGLVSF
jgi:alpha-tubulin suppressor-like RCC1 family protein